MSLVTFFFVVLLLGYPTEFWLLWFTRLNVVGELFYACRPPFSFWWPGRIPRGMDFMATGHGQARKRNRRFPCRALS